MSHHGRENHWRMAISATSVVVIAAIVAFFSAQYAISQSNAHTDAKSARAQALILTAKEQATHLSLLNSYNSGIGSCRRGNIIRQHVNTNEDILISFLKTARTARLAAAKSASGPTASAIRALNLAAANAYDGYILGLRHIAIVDCTSVYIKPQ